MHPVELHERMFPVPFGRVGINDLVQFRPVLFRKLVQRLVALIQADADHVQGGFCHGAEARD